jgi:hypothetical protein
MQNVILLLRKIFDKLVLIELDILHINVSTQAILFLPTLNTSKNCFVNNKMACMLLFYVSAGETEAVNAYFKPVVPVTHLNY